MKVERVGLGFTPDDKAVLAKVKKQLAPTHGKISTIGAVRMGLRKLLEAK